MAGSYNNISVYLEPSNGWIPILEERMKVRSPGYMFSASYKNWKEAQSLKKKGLSDREIAKRIQGSMWDGWVRFYNKRSSGFFFPTGFLFSRKFSQIRQELRDVREGDPSYKEPKVFGITLRDYQLEAVYKCLEAQRGIVAAATNSGKTEIAAAVISAIRKPTLFIVHRSNLAMQVKDRLKERLGLDEVNMFGSGGKDFGPVTVATVQSLYSLLKRCQSNRNLRPPELDLFQVVFVDEAHHNQSSQYKYVLKQLPKAFWRFGLTGTPHRDMDDPKWWGFVAYTGDVLFEIRNDKLIEMGVSAEVNITFYRFKHDSLIYPSNKWHEIFRSMIEDNLERNIYIANLAKESGSRVLITVRTIRQGENLSKLIPGSVLSTGQESPERRKKDIEQLASGEIKVIIATGWFYEGMDVPEIKTLINASGGLSDIELLQKLGRGLRKKSDGSSLTYIDIYDEDDGILEKHSIERCATLEKDGHKIRITSGGLEKQLELF